MFDGRAVACGVYFYYLIFALRVNYMVDLLFLFDRIS